MSDTKFLIDELNLFIRNVKKHLQKKELTMLTEIKATFELNQELLNFKDKEGYNRGKLDAEMNQLPLDDDLIEKIMNLANNDTLGWEDGKEEIRKLLQQRNQ